MEKSIKWTGRKYIMFFLPVFSFILFASGILIKLQIPLAEWDRVSLYAAENWSIGINSPWLFDHPPLYAFYLTFLFKIFGPSIAAARLGNALCILLTALLLFHFALKLYDLEASIWAASIYLLSPVSIQGISSMDVADTSLLPLLFIVTIYAFKNIFLNQSIKNTIFLGMCIGVCLWAKITSSIALVVSFVVGSIVLFYIDGDRPKYKLLALNTLALIFGVSFFLLTWLYLSNFLGGNEAFFYPLKTIYASINSQFDQDVGFLKFIYTGYYFTRIIAWISPFFFLIYLISSFSTLKNVSQKDYYKKQLTLTVLFYFFGYILIGGTNSGFPRYHAAILPLVCIIAGPFFAEFANSLDIKQIKIIFFSSFSLVILYFIILKDPLLFLNLDIKEMLLFKKTLFDLVKALLINFMPFYIIPLLFSGILILLLKIDNNRIIITFFLIFGTLTTLISLDVLQFIAPYRTSYQYGAEGRNELIQKVDNNIRIGDNVFGTPEFIYELKRKNIPYVGWGEWQSKERFLNFIKEKRPKAIIGGLTINTYEQLKWMLSEETQLILSKNYSFERIGTYYLWLRIL